MNLFFILGEGTGDGGATIVTPALSGSLLPGVTRRSLLQVARDLGYSTEERVFSTEEWQRTATSGEMTEAFACGTAAVITPVGTVKSTHGDFDIAGGATGSITMQLREQLTGIQRGTVEDTHGWMTTLVG